jgi:hypothetical protein
LRGKGGADIGGRQVVGLKRGGIDVDLDLTFAPAIGVGTAAPSTWARPGRMALMPKSNVFCSPSVGDDSANCRIGTVEAL